MPHYAHVLIEHGNTKWKPGEVLPDDLPGLDELVKWGSAGTEPPVLGAALPVTVRRFDGDFTGEQIDDPTVQTPLAGEHRTAAEHREQDPDAYDEGNGDA